MLIAQIIGNSFDKRDDHLTKVCFEWYETCDFVSKDTRVDIITFEEPTAEDNTGGDEDIANGDISSLNESLDREPLSSSQRGEEDQRTSKPRTIKSITQARALDQPLSEFMTMVKEKTHGALEFQILEDIMKFQRIVRVEKESMAAYMQRFRLQQKRVEAHGFKMSEDLHVLTMLTNSRLGDDEIRNLLRLPRTPGNVAPEWDVVMQEVRRLYHSGQGPDFKVARLSSWFTDTADDRYEDVTACWDSKKANLRLFSESGEAVPNEAICAYLAKTGAMFVKAKKQGKWTKRPFEASNKNWSRKRGKTPRRSSNSSRGSRYSKTSSRRNWSRGSSRQPSRHRGQRPRRHGRDRSRYSSKSSRRSSVSRP